MVGGGRRTGGGNALGRRRKEARGNGELGRRRKEARGGGALVGAGSGGTGMLGWIGVLMEDDVGVGASVSLQDSHRSIYIGCEGNRILFCY